MSWVTLWKAVLLFTLVGYTFLVVIVFYKGLGDIKGMFADLKAETGESDL